MKENPSAGSAGLHIKNGGQALVTWQLNKTKTPHVSVPLLSLTHHRCLRVTQYVLNVHFHQTAPVGSATPSYLPVLNSCCVSKWLTCAMTVKQHGASLPADLQHKENYAASDSCRLRLQWLCGDRRRFSVSIFNIFLPLFTLLSRSQHQVTKALFLCSLHNSNPFLSYNSNKSENKSNAANHRRPHILDSFRYVWYLVTHTLLEHSNRIQLFHNSVQTIFLSPLTTPGFLSSCNCTVQSWNWQKPGQRSWILHNLGSYVMVVIKHNHWNYCKFDHFDLSAADEKCWLSSTDTIKHLLLVFFFVTPAFILG